MRAGRILGGLAAAAVIAAVCPICYMDYENDALYMKSTLVSTGFEG